MAIEMVDLPSYNMVMFHSYIRLTEGKSRKTFDDRNGLKMMKITENNENLSVVEAQMSSVWYQKLDRS